jgi:GntR family transcriptional repressor for pyruvate dehydrogenase complex
VDIFEQSKLIPKIVETFQNKIIQGELKGGDQLPSQNKLAESMGISRGTLREGLNQLVPMGIIEMRQGRGTYVKSISPASFMTSLSPALLMNKSSAEELLDARLYIEGAVASLAAKKATGEEIRELEKILDEMKDDYRAGNIEDFINKDVEFHMLIAKSSKNQVLMKVVQTIRDILYKFIADFFTAMPETVKNATDYHTKIFRAIERHDPIEAKKQMESHIISLIRRMSDSKQNGSISPGKGKKKKT